MYFETINSSQIENANFHQWDENKSPPNVIEMDRFKKKETR